MASRRCLSRGVFQRVCHLRTLVGSCHRRAACTSHNITVPPRGATATSSPDVGEGRGKAVADSQALAFNRDAGTLVVAVSSPQAATRLNNYFAMTIRRAVATTNTTIQGIPINAARLELWPDQRS